MDSSDPQVYPVFQCCFCDKSYYNKRALGAHWRFCRLKVPGQNAAGHAEASSNAQGGSDVLNFHIPRRQRTVRKEEEALPVLSEQPENNTASYDAQGGNTDASGFHVLKRKRPILTEPRTSEVKADREPEEEVDVLKALLLLQEQPGKDTSSHDDPGTANPDDEQAADNPDVVLTMCFHKSSSSVGCYGGGERSGNLLAVMGTEVERLSHNDGCRGVTDCVDNSCVMQKQNQKLDLSDPVVMQQQNRKLDLSDTVALQKQNQKLDLSDPVVMQQQNHKLDLNVLAPSDNSEASSNAQGGSDVLNFHIPRRQRTVRKEEEALPVLSEQPENNTASDDAQGGNTDASGFHVLKRKRPILTEPRTSEVKADREPEEEVDVLKALWLLQEQPGKDTSSHDDQGTANPDDEQAADNPDVVLTTCFHKSSSSVGCYGGGERSGNLFAVMGTEAERLSHNDGCRGVTDCVDNSCVMQKQNQKLDLSDPVVMQQQNQKLDLSVTVVLQKQNQKLDLSDPVVMQQQNHKLDLNVLAPSDNSDQKTLTLSFSPVEKVIVVALLKPHPEKNSASVDRYVGIEKSGNEAPVVEEEEEVELSHNDGHQGVADCPENSAVMELKKHKLDLNVPPFVQEQNMELDLNVRPFVQEQNAEPDLNISDDSVVMQEKNLMIDLNAPVSTNNSDMETPSVIDGQTKQTAAATFRKKSGNEVPVAVKEDVQLSASDHHLSLVQEQSQKLEVKPNLSDLNL